MDDELTGYCFPDVLSGEDPLLGVTGIDDVESKGGRRAGKWGASGVGHRVR